MENYAFRLKTLSEPPVTQPPADPTTRKPPQPQPTQTQPLFLHSILVTRNPQDISSDHLPL